MEKSNKFYGDASRKKARLFAQQKKEKETIILKRKISELEYLKIGFCRAIGGSKDGKKAYMNENLVDKHNEEIDKKLIPLKQLLLDKKGGKIISDSKYLQFNKKSNHYYNSQERLTAKENENASSIEKQNNTCNKALNRSEEAYKNHIKRMSCVNANNKRLTLFCASNNVSAVITSRKKPNTRHF
ncbi:MAG: hypothetical protein J6C50_04330 [Rickettsiales bacterium]|nr:hypothetical protein [Rickettsiales bacterium]